MNNFMKGLLIACTVGVLVYAVGAAVVYYFFN